MMDWLCGVQLVYRSMLLVWEQSFFLVWLCLLRSKHALCSERKREWLSLMKPSLIPLRFVASYFYHVMNSRILLMIRSNHSHALHNHLKSAELCLCCYKKAAVRHIPRLFCLLGINENRASFLSTRTTFLFRFVVICYIYATSNIQKE